MFRYGLTLLALVAAAATATAQTAAPPARQGGALPTIEDRTSGLRKIDGYYPLYSDDRTGTMLLEIAHGETPFLFSNGLAAGLGSNDLGLDRGIGGQGRIVSFQRLGPRMVLVQPNQTFRSSSSNPLERKAVEDSFAKSMLWGFTIVAETGPRVLVDATDFFVRDVFGAVAGLRPGNYRVDRTRSGFNLPNVKGFPKNTEVDVILTFVNEQQPSGRGGAGPMQGPEQIPAPAVAGMIGRTSGMFSGTVASVTPTPDSVTLRQHMSFVELPDSNFTPRVDDPRAGYGGLAFADYSAKVNEPMIVRYIRKHRLQKKDPKAAISEPVKPIEYWVDPGAPPDVQKALIEGASWWNQAFEAAGFRNAFKVAVLPEGADPMDIRYNMINWVHRSTRGWSTGGSIADPRTGEIIKGTVTLGSLRDRQDHMIIEGLLSPYKSGSEVSQVAYDTAMARIRQLSAHEVGHTLGLGHNYYDSTKGRISVMDYPHPLAELRPDGTLDLSKAYTAEIGAWDKVAINFGYREFAPGTNVDAELTRILTEAWDQDLRYFTNQDSNIHPRVEQWSNGVNQADELDRLMKIRRSALDRMGPETIRTGAPMATIEEPLVPVFMYHRYTVESASSMIAGQDYIYAMRGDGRTPVKWESAANQRKALESLAATLKPSELTIPKKVLDSIPPRPPGFAMHRELFPRTTGEGFDPIAPGAIAADVTIGFVLDSDRAARMVAQHAVDPSLPGLDEVIDRLVKATFDATAANPYEEEIRRATQRVMVDRLMGLAAANQNAQVRALASLKLQRLAARIAPETGKSDADAAQHMLLASDIRRFLERPNAPTTMLPAAPAPPGAPIGDEGPQWLARPPR